MNKGKKYFLTENLKKILDEPGIRNDALDLIDFWSKEYKRMSQDQSPERASYELSRYLEKTISQHIINQKELIESKGGLKCKKGCSYCCEIVISVSLDEALSLYKTAEHNNMTFNWPKIERQAKYKTEEWLSQPKEDWTCALLKEDKTCSLYDYRPYTCRKYLVFNDPEGCNVANKENEERIVNFCSPESEMAIGGAWDATGDVGPLPKQLLKARDIYERKENSNKSERKK